MASRTEPPLDEVQWSSPQYAQQLGGIHNNTLLPYFYESPFYDQTSNNAMLTVTAMRNPSLFHVIQTRQAFEDYLLGMNGVEYRVVQDPSDNDRIPNHEHSGVWVIRKQRRIKPAPADPIQEDTLEPLSTYFVVGENVYMAPTVGSILSSKLLSVSSALTKVFQSAFKIPIHNPALGRVYALPSAKQSAGGGSAPNTVQNSKEATPMPETQPLSFLQANEGPEDGSTLPSEKQQAALLAETLSNSIRYGREYMDEHPLMGEPGSFIVQKSKDLQVPIGKENVAEKRSIPIPPPLKTDIRTEVEKKGKETSLTGGDKSPLSPVGGGKKRKKSKIQTPRTPKTPK